MISIVSFSFVNDYQMHMLSQSLVEHDDNHQYADENENKARKNNIININLMPTALLKVRNGDVFVGGWNSSLIDVINPGSNQVEHCYHIAGRGLVSMAQGQDGCIYMATPGAIIKKCPPNYNDVKVADINGSLVGIIQTKESNIYAVDTSHNRIVVLDPTVSYINSKRNEKFIKVGSRPRYLLDSSSGKIYVTNAGDGTVSVIDNSNDVVKTIKVGRWPRQLIQSSLGELFVTNTGSDTVSVINEQDQLEKTIRVGESPSSLLKAADGNIYVT